MDGFAKLIATMIVTGKGWCINIGILLIFSVYTGYHYKKAGIDNVPQYARHSQQIDRWMHYREDKWRQQHTQTPDGIGLALKFVLVEALGKRLIGGIVLGANTLCSQIFGSFYLGSFFELLLAGFLLWIASRIESE